MLNKVTICIGDDENVLCEVINASQINLRFEHIVIPVIEDDEIITLKVGKGVLALFGEITVNIDSKVNSVYKINKIEKITDRTYSIYSSVATKTNKFILPLLSTNYNRREYFLYDTFFENSYINIDSTIDLGIELNYPLILLYRYSESEVYRAFESRIRNHPLFVKTLDINKYQVLFIFNIGEHALDVEFFKQGAYSKLSSQLKDKIMKFYDYTDGGTMHQILFQGPKLRKQIEMEFDTVLPKGSELYSKPTLTQEIYYG